MERGMSCSTEFINTVRETLAPMGEVRTRMMMGDYVVYLNDKLVSTVDVYVNFQSAGNPYVRMQCYQTQWGLRLSYLTSSGSSTLPYYDTSWQYGMDAYRTVTFDEPPTGTLLTWLQANAVQK